VRTLALTVSALIAFPAVAPAITGGTLVRDSALRRSILPLGGCSSVLVAPDTVLTAAHCVWSVPLGELSMGPGRRVTAVAVEPRFTQARTRTDVRERDDRGDLALVRFDWPVARATPFALLTPDAARRAVRTGQRATILGYGKTGERKLDLGRLRSAPVHVGSDSGCSRTWSQLGGLYRRSWEPASMICAVDRTSRRPPYRDTCNGDSGGPLLIRTAMGLRLAGITAWGGRTCGNGDPGAYTDVAAYHAWLTLPDRTWAPVPENGQASITGDAREGGTLTCRGPRFVGEVASQQVQWRINRTPGGFTTASPTYVPTAADRDGRSAAASWR
jgi:hypothetical protein